jgi:malate permease and related proteins
MLVLLGLELTRIEWSHSIRALGLSVVTKLVIAPIVGILLAGVFGLQGAERQANIVETAVPAAVVTTVVATEYNLRPSLVTAMVFIGTLLSPLTITPLLVYLAR